MGVLDFILGAIGRGRDHWRMWMVNVTDEERVVCVCGVCVYMWCCINIGDFGISSWVRVVFAYWAAAQTNQSLLLNDFDKTLSL